MTYEVGDIAVITVSFTDANGAPADPTTVILTIRNPDNTISTPAVGHAATGLYTYSLTITQSGVYLYQWAGTGAIVAVVEGSVVVNPSVLIPQPGGLTAYDLIYAAYRIAGVLRGPRRGLSPSEISEGIDVLNSLLDSWNADNLAIFTVGSAIYNLIVNKQTYTIGKDPSGLTTADFDAPRPARITNANIISQVAGGQPVRTALELFEVDSWAGIKVQAVGSAIPQKMYNDHGAPFSTLKFYPFPNAAAQLELYSWSALTQVLSQADKMNLPPAYRKALEYNLAIDIAPRYPQFPMHQTVFQQAAKAKYDLEGMNSDIPLMSCDPALLSAKKSTFNYLTGE